MRPGAHAQAAIEVLTDLDTRSRPAADALKDWGLSHRFAGSRDRALISSLVHDALRRRASIAWRMGAETPRALVLGALGLLRGMEADAIAAAFSDSPHAPAALDEEERTALVSTTLDGAPAWVMGDYPEWLDPHLARSLGEDRAIEGAALAVRAPLDLRVNTLKTDRDAVQAQLAHLSAETTPLSPLGLRVPFLQDGRGPPIHTESAFVKGHIEVQDEGSQIAALIAGALPGEQVMDLCAGAGGKTLALAAAMNNRGQIYAYDREARRLAPLHERANRAGVRNLQIRSPRRQDEVLGDLGGKMDLVLVDAPCTGTGTWRRNPDAKWRLQPDALANRQAEQDAVLAQAAHLVKPGGRLVYVTCSLLAEENQDRIAAFLAAHPAFSVRPLSDMLAAAELDRVADFATPESEFLLLTPHRSGTDGFFVACLTRVQA